MNQLIKYDAACRAIAEAKRVDEVKSIRDVSIAMKAYARQAGNREMEADAIEIRMRATRRMDQMRIEQKNTIGLAKGAREAGTTRGKNPPASIPTLAEAGIDKDLAKEGRKLGALSEPEFEKAITTARDAIGKVVKAALQNEDKADARAIREQELAQKILMLPNKRYGVIFADPEWRFEPWSRKTGMDRAADNHYSTSSLEVIKSRPIAAIAADDCILFLCATRPMLPHALEVMEAWGFDYRTCVIWSKDKIGTGYWFRDANELLLIGLKGYVPAPAMGEQWNSQIDAPVGEHSEKPEAFYRMIEAYFPNLPKIELNARHRRDGWDSWGDEV